MNLLSIILGKTIIKLSRLSGRHGSALPGLIIERLNPKFMERSLNSLPEGVIVVTGTNGKTTTTKVLANLFEREGLRVLSNPTGSNFTRGIVSTLLDSTSVRGKLNYDIAVLELDEAFSRKFVKSIKPEYVVLLNVMRDQLDRYGEIDKTAEMLLETAQEASQGVIINQNDNRLVDIAKQLKTPVTYFGSSEALQRLLPTDDMMHSGGEVVKHEKPSDVELTSYENQLAVYSFGDDTYNAQLQIAGIHNALNSAAALATVKARTPQIDPEVLMNVLEEIAPAWGRGEVCHVGNTTITLALVKNPAGMQQSLLSYKNDTADLTVFAINDQFADGRDVSWLWDVSFTTVSEDTKLYVSGTRAYDMALRLQYDNKKIQRVQMNENQILQHILKKKPRKIMIYCTYTAMLAFRKSLSRQADLQEGIWG